MKLARPALPAWVARLKPRERRLALGAGIVILSWGVVSFLLQPLWSRMDALKSEVESQTEKLDALNALIARQHTVAQAYERVAAYLQPAEGGDHAGLLNDLEILARQAELHLNLKPRPGKRDAHGERVEVEVDVEGPQARVLAFLDELLRLPRLVSVERLRLASVPAKNDIVRANLVLHHLILR